MSQNFLKNLFKRREVDWDSRDYLKKNLELLQETKTHDLYQDDRGRKEKLEQELLDLMSKT
jgi:hypothetical protein